MLGASLTRSSRRLLSSTLQQSSRRNVAQMAVAEGAASSVVKPEWLAERLDKPGYKVLDATWYMPNSGKDAKADYLADRIPGSQFFDIDGVANLSIALPHMVPSEGAFAAAMDALGISNDTFVVLYDRTGLFSAPRAWWTFRIFGHSKVAVLEGGLPAWKAGELPLDTNPADEAALSVSRDAAQNPPIDGTKYKATLDTSKVRGLQQMLALAAAAGAPAEQIVDARSRGRFLGQDPEPRPGLPSGHIPGSKNVPFPSVLGEGGTLRPKEELLGVFQEAGVNVDQPIVASCGSGLTACILALALHEATGQLVPVYDGSWTEWALRDDTPRATTEP